MKVILKELPKNETTHPATGLQDPTDITHMIYIIDDVSDRPIKAGTAKSLAEAETIQKEFKQIVASME